MTLLPEMTDCEWSSEAEGFRAVAKFEPRVVLSMGTKTIEILKNINGSGRPGGCRGPPEAAKLASESLLGAAGAAISYYHTIILSQHHETKMVKVSFGAKSRSKTLIESFTPSPRLVSIK